MCGRGSANADAGLSGALEAINKDGEGVLHRALSKGQPEVAHLLIKCGARVDARSSSGDTAMHCAARSGLDTVALMLAGAEHERPSHSSSFQAAERRADGGERDAAALLEHLGPLERAPVALMRAPARALAEEHDLDDAQVDEAHHHRRREA